MPFLLLLLLIKNKVNVCVTNNSISNSKDVIYLGNVVYC